MSNEGAPGAVRLSDYGLLLRRQWAVLLAGLLLGAVLAAGYLAVAPREYTSTTSVLVTPSTAAATQGAGRAGEINLDTEAQLVTATETVAAAADRLGSTQSARELVDRTTVTVPPNTDILTIAFVAPTAEEAQAGARAFAEAYLDARRATTEAALDAEYDALQSRIDEIEEQLQTLRETIATLPADSPLRASAEDQAAALSNQLAGLGSQQNQVRAAAIRPGRIVTQPGLPTSPSSPDVLTTVPAGALLGLLAGFGIAAVRHRADDRIRTAEDVQRRTGVPLSAVIGTPLREGEVALAAPSAPDGRAYARLRNLVTSSLEQHTRRVVLVAGVKRGGGTVAANLAASLARAGEDVCLVCADVFGNTAEALLGRPAGPGLAEVLEETRSLEGALRTVPGLPNMRLLAPGKDPDRADALLQGRGARELVETLQAGVAYVVVEVPSTADGTAAQTLVSAADLVVLVVETGSTSARDVADALGQLESARRPVLGAVTVSYDRDEAADRDKVRPSMTDGAARPGSGSTPAGDEAERAVARTKNGTRPVAGGARR